MRARLDHPSLVGGRTFVMIDPLLQVWLHSGLPCVDLGQIYCFWRPIHCLKPSVQPLISRGIWETFHLLFVLLVGSLAVR